MTSGDIFADEGSPALARASDPATSHAAAVTMNTARLEQEVLSIIQSYGAGGCTADDIEARLPSVRSHSITPRLKPLRVKGFIVIIGKRPGRSGRGQQVMVSKEFHNVEAA